MAKHKNNNGIYIVPWLTHEHALRYWVAIIKNVIDNIKYEISQNIFKNWHKPTKNSIFKRSHSNIIVPRGVARGKCMWKQGRRSGQNQFVPQLCPAGGLGGAASRPVGRSPGSKRIFGNNLLQIGWKSDLSLTSHVCKHESTYFNNEIVLLA